MGLEQRILGMNNGLTVGTTKKDKKRAINQNSPVVTGSEVVLVREGDNFALPEHGVLRSDLLLSAICYRVFEVFSTIPFDLQFYCREIIHSPCSNHWGNHHNSSSSTPRTSGRDSWSRTRRCPHWQRLLQRKLRRTLRRMVD